MFLKIKDSDGDVVVLNTEHIICIRRNNNPTYSKAKSVIYFGSGYCDSVYLVESVEDFCTSYRECVGGNNG